MKNNYKQNDLSLYAICIFTALGLLAVCSKSSPLYPLNDWPDVNCFHTVGKGIIHGKVPYVDLLEQKGPYVYFLGAIAYLMDGRGFAGYFLFEIISMYFFLLYAYKISDLYCRPPGFAVMPPGKHLAGGLQSGCTANLTVRSIYCSRTRTWLLPLLGAAVVSAKSFVHGGSWEQISLGIFAYAIYSLLAAMRGENLDSRTLVLNGFLAGFIFWSKFNLVGLYIAWVLVVALWYLHQRRWKVLGKAALIFAGGCTAATLLPLIYFGVHGAVKPWLKVYLYDNIFSYGFNSAAPGEAVNLWKRCASVLENTVRSLADRGNLGYSLPLFFGICFFLLAPLYRISLWEKLAVCFMGMGLAGGIFIGSMRHDYYGLPLAVFAIWGIWLGSILVERAECLLKGLPLCRKRGQAEMILWGATLLCTMYLSYCISPNTYLLLADKDDMPQYRFAERILASDDISLLNYLFLDGGFYTVTGGVPTEKTFCLLNADRYNRMLEQQEYIRQQRTHWVVTWLAQEASEEQLRSLDTVSEYYDLADYMYFYFEGDNRTYALYEKKD